MPTNKEALIRYRVINRCIKDFKYASLDRLINSCEDALDISHISKRTIYQDIRDMKEDSRLGYMAPIKRDPNKGYYYDDPDYSIDNIPLNEEEVKALSFAATMLDQFSNTDLFSTFTGAVQKIVDTMNIKRMSDEEDLLSFIEFEQSPVSLGHQFIDPVILAIKEKHVISFSYQRFVEKRPHNHTVHPYLLKQYHNRWYLIGWNHDKRKIFTYSLDRFSGAPKEVDLPYYDIGFNPREFYKSVIGIVMPFEQPQKVVLKFSKEQAWYVITQPIHSSQNVEMKDDHAVVNLEVVPTYELIMLIMGWGPEVEVLKPASLRKEIMELHRKSLRE